MAQYAYNKVMWSEGLLVGPHHFQQSDRYHEATLDFRLKPLAPYGWGAIELRIDEACLRNSSIFKLERFRGVFASGTAINVPEGDAAPASREVNQENFPPSSHRLDVYLALPVERTDGAYGRLPDNCTSLSETRYVPEFVRVVDETTGENPQEVARATKNLRILFGSESADNHERFKIAELIRQGNGSILLAEDYIPACLVLSASSRLKNILHDFIYNLAAKSSALLGTCSQRPSERYEFDHRNIKTLLTVHTLVAFIPVLKHLCQVSSVHPEIIFRYLLQLAGQLSILSENPNGTDLPQYKHEDLAFSFEQFGQTLRQMLNPTPFSIVLQETTSHRGYRIFHTEYPIDEKLLSPHHQFYIAVNAVERDAQRRAQLFERMSETATVAAMHAIDAHIEYATGGVRLIPRSFPEAMPPRSDLVCFELVRDEAWTRIETTKTLALYLPPEFRNEFEQIEIQLLVTKA